MATKKAQRKTTKRNRERGETAQLAKGVIARLEWLRLNAPKFAHLGPNGVQLFNEILAEPHLGIPGSAWQAAMLTWRGRKPPKRGARALGLNAIERLQRNWMDLVADLLEFKAAGPKRDSLRRVIARVNSDR